MKTQGERRPRARIDWEEALSGVPTQDFFEGRSLADLGDLEEVVRDFNDYVEGGRFATWEAVIRDEQGLPLTKRERRLLGKLMCFVEEDEDILRIDDIARPSEPWWGILRRFAPALLRLPLVTDEAGYEVVETGWPGIVSALEGHGAGLSLPEGAASPVEVVPEELRHELWIQTCCGHLMGIGQELGGETMSLAQDAERERVDSLVAQLRDHEASVRALGLTTERLVATFVKLPAGEGALLARLLAERLKVGSPGEFLVATEGPARGVGHAQVAFRPRRAR